jgi:hypothetical protein
MKKKSVCICIDPDIKKRGMKAAAKDGRSFSGLINELLKRFIKKVEKK